jgi:ubiquinol-cytochrome c reductase cytochrome c subunit
MTVPHPPHARPSDQGPRSVTSPRSTSGRSGRLAGRLKALSGTAVIALALGVVGLGYTAFAAPSTAQEDDTAQQSLAIREGKRIFDLGCSTCHGLNLQGGAGGPSLIGVGAASVVFQMESGRMPLHAGVQQAPAKTPKYSLEEIDQVAAYVQANGGGPTVPDGDLLDGNLQLGGDLFRTNCASCHNFAGSGGALTYGKYAPELNSSSARVIYSAMQSGPGNMPRFGDSQLSPEEKRAITRYVKYVTQHQDPGGANLGRYGPVSEGLLAWIVGILSLVGLTLWIGARS